MSCAIKVENLSKKYVIRHQAPENYTTLRDIIAHKTRRIFSKPGPRNPLAETPLEEEFWALQNINFEIPQGEQVGIIGRNGAGKSTLLKILSRITEPTTGKITILGRVASLLEVGTGFHPELTGRENIYLNAAILGMSRVEIQKKFDAIVDFAEIEQFLDTPVKRYSSGMYVRLAFAVAAHIEPDILIIDEVLAVGDALFQKKCSERMDEIGRQGRTLLFVSHNINAVLQQTKRAIVLSKGRLVAFEASDSAVNTYLDHAEKEQPPEVISGLVPWLRVANFAIKRETHNRYFNKPIDISLNLELDAPVKNLRITVIFHNTASARVLTTHGLLEDLDADTHSLNLRLAGHRLLPGTYYVTLAIRRDQEIIFRRNRIESLELFVDDVADADLVPYLPYITSANDKYGGFCKLDIIRATPCS